MTILLAGDIGGTKTILRLVKSEHLAVASLRLPSQAVLAEQSYPSQDYADLVPIVRQFLTAATQQLGEQVIPETACFGIAGPVSNNISELTNLSWCLEAKRLEQDLAIAQVSLINDFAAVGYGILGLTDKDLQTLQPGQPSCTAPIAVIGAGTGLGEGFLIPHPDGGYQVFGTEGGHADFAAQSALEFRLLAYLKEKNSLDRISVERVVSGMGIVSIYQFLSDQDVSQESARLAELHATWEREIGQANKTVDLAAEISRAAGDDQLCKQTMKVFVEAYGSEAGNLALKLLPYGGLYIAGGIAAKILPLMEQGGFMRSFLAKGRMSDLLKQIPVHIVMNPKVGLIGASLFAAKNSFH